MVGSNEPISRFQLMGFDINYGSPGFLGLLISFMLAAVCAIVALILLRVVKDGHDKVVEEIESEDGDLRW